MGGLFRQFVKNSEGDAVRSMSGVRRMAAVQLALNSVNNKSDGVFDNLLPHAEVSNILLY